MKVNLPVTGKEYILGEDDFLISRTDLKGMIVYANPAFIRTSGFTYEELSGQNHNIVRHPDMPPGAFQNLWDTIKTGRSWNGVVKNRRKNGDYYWVRANVTPRVERGKIVGFTSVRVKASQDEIDYCDKAYKEINEGSTDYFLNRGTVLKKGFLNCLARINPRSLRTRLTLMSLFGTGTQAASVMVSIAGHTSLAEVSPWIIGGQLALLGFNAFSLAALARMSFYSIANPIEDTANFAAQVAAGNVDTPAPAIPDNEMKHLLFFLNTIRKSMSQISKDVERSVNSLSESSQSLIVGNRELDERTEMQAASVQQAAASMEEITTTVQQNSANAVEAKKLALDSATFVNESCQSMASVVHTMKRISETSKRMTDILNVIDSIAFQTNILALNASVEAARAGEHGKGFSVVATEVRNLASKSASSAQEVRNLINDSSEEIRKGYDLVSETENRVESLAQLVNQLSTIMSEITNASQEQSIGISLINDGISKIDLVTLENANLVKVAAEASSTLDRHLVDAIRTLEVFSREGSQGAR